MAEAGQSKPGNAAQAAGGLYSVEDLASGNAAAGAMLGQQPPSTPLQRDLSEQVARTRERVRSPVIIEDANDIPMANPVEEEDRDDPPARAQKAKKTKRTRAAAASEEEEEEASCSGSSSDSDKSYRSSRSKASKASKAKRRRKASGKVSRRSSVAAGRTEEQQGGIIYDAIPNEELETIDKDRLLALYQSTVGHKDFKKTNKLGGAGRKTKEAMAALVKHHDPDGYAALLSVRDPFLEDTVEIIFKGDPTLRRVTFIGDRLHVVCKSQFVDFDLRADYIAMSNGTLLSVINEELNQANKIAHHQVRFNILTWVHLERLVKQGSSRARALGVGPYTIDAAGSCTSKSAFRYARIDEQFLAKILPALRPNINVNKGYHSDSEDEDKLLVGTSLTKQHRAAAAVPAEEEEKEEEKEEGRAYSLAAPRLKRKPADGWPEDKEEEVEATAAAKPG